MIRAATGLSTRSSAVDAAREAAGRAATSLGTRPDWCLAFVSSGHGPHLDALLGALAEAGGTPYVAGCSAAGVLAEGREVEDGPFVAVLAVASDQLRATPFLFTDGGDHGLTAGIRLGQRLTGSRDTDDLVLLWSDPFHIRPDRLLQALDATLGAVPVAGAAASGSRDATGTFQFSGIEFDDRAVSGVRLGGAFAFHVAVSQGCRSLGDPLRVTRSHENLVLEVDGRPAFDVLRECAPRGALESPSRMHRSVFYGILPERGSRDYLVRNIIAADPDTGVLAVADAVEEGQWIVFTLREPGAAREQLARALRHIKERVPERRVRFGVYFNCLARGRSLYQEEGVDGRLLREAFPEVPIIGLFGNAEIAPLHGVNRIFTYTGVLVLVSE